jgi:hypothetical protein
MTTFTAHKDATPLHLSGPHQLCTSSNSSLNGPFTARPMVTRYKLLDLRLSCTAVSARCQTAGREENYAAVQVESWLLDTNPRLIGDECILRMCPSWVDKGRPSPRPVALYNRHLNLTGHRTSHAGITTAQP